MIKIIKEKWAKNEAALREAFAKMRTVNNLDYLDLVRLAFDVVYNDESSYTGVPNVDTSKIVEINHGDYQGTLLYLIPEDTYQPSEYEYLMTCAGYGSCSGCDALMHIQGWDDNEPPTEVQINDLVGLCRDIMASTIKPYCGGWRHDERFDPVEFE